MDTLFAALTCCLLAISSAAAQTVKGDSPTTKPSVSNNMTQTTELMMSLHTVGNTASTSKVTENTTTAFSSTTWNNETLNKTTIHPQTSQSTTILAPLTNSTTLMTSTPAALTPTVNASETTTGYTRTPDTTAITSTNSTPPVNTTSHSVDATTQGLTLNISEQNLTIVFSVVLGVFLVSLVVFMFRRCRQKIQYLHQPLNNSDCPDAFVADDDTLVISGGLYDGHPMDDNAPAVPDDQSRFRLEFLH
ncbi:sialomucin core protein 24-like [Limanda limanda]|uniref:sialomucin core protein 24-like n=1 Tax=Limanda limanda TaxID=27771 RepID=UPI0029C8ED44|nr:sialomucin core protein 24-like [Limanda limanda]